MNRNFNVIGRFIRMMVVFFLLTHADAQTAPPVYVVVFTHIEDNCPDGELGTSESRDSYAIWRDKLIAIGELFYKQQVKWVFEPDWKFLLAALQYEESPLTNKTNNKNLLRYLKEDLNVSIDPHSHEHQGYSYTDVAHLLDSLGVGGSSVVGGHVWDPNLPQFAEWDRFRVPVAGSKFPWAVWRGDILMGSATPGHINDPAVSGVWRPKDRYHFFEDDSQGNIVAVGQYKNSAHESHQKFIQNLNELITLYTNQNVPVEYMLTASKHLSPADISAPHSLKIIADSLLVPLLALETAGKVKITDFTSLVADWKSLFYARPFIYNPDVPTSVVSHPIHSDAFILFPNYPNPFNPSTIIQYALPRSGYVRLVIYDVMGRHIKTLIDTQQPAGQFQVSWDGMNEQNQAVAAGVYFCHLRVCATSTGSPSTGSGGGAGQEFVKVIKLVLVK